MVRDTALHSLVLPLASHLFETTSTKLLMKLLKMWWFHVCNILFFVFLFVCFFVCFFFGEINMLRAEALGAIVAGRSCTRR